MWEPSGNDNKYYLYSGTDGAQITVVGELHKLAGWYTKGRDAGGLHYWSDGYASLLVAEAFPPAVKARAEGESCRLGFATDNSEKYEEKTGPLSGQVWGQTAVMNSSTRFVSK